MKPELNLRQVDVFRAIVKFGTVTAAAAALGSSQPTLTREVLRLEASVGFQLFERRRQRLHPTARALKLYHAIEEAYSGLDKINASLHRMRAASGEILQVSTLPTFAQSLLPEAVARLHREAPGLTIEIDNGDPRNQSPISGFNFDIGLIEGEYDDPTTEVIPLGLFRQVCLIPAGHPLASGTGPLHLQDFEDQAFVSLGPKDPYRLILDRLFDEAGVTRRLPVTMQSANGACEMVRSGIGVSILNPLTALGYLGDRVVLRAFAQAPGFVVSALHPVDRPWVDTAGRLAGHLKAICAEAQQRLQALQLI
ncbi:DNA-binding transcriptional LysR family regulator [Gemmobacter caeni]|uniref:DNA-binding transcriptional LysR family regulator n=1 Tax=Gemmobacter caeni TaxID=589035 RepID=A0A2T6AWG7_9RHOB|nr:LysR substrate-binding domain-containing protein [Gemmobacter caeni]PTX48151.1 DNA-binding transcriptional LysR family regulator [Gemmobacter caeni]TWI96967.1 DNA-binding transcriptional LysR family regulator [Gemmobacter caeni]